jgi:hypothetical protein
MESTIPKQLETIIMLPSELNAIIGKRTKSTNDINQMKFHPRTKLSIQTQCRQSELELIFQVKNSFFFSFLYQLLTFFFKYIKKRAQRSEQNRT